jgi:hypothetical protein
MVQDSALLQHGGYHATATISPASTGYTVKRLQGFMLITVKLRLRDKHAAELNRQARAVNFVWQRACSMPGGHASEKCCREKCAYAATASVWKCLKIGFVADLGGLHHQ